MFDILDLTSWTTTLFVILITALFYLAVFNRRFLEQSFFMNFVFVEPEKRRSSIRKSPTRKSENGKSSISTTENYVENPRTSSIEKSPAPGSASSSTSVATLKPPSGSEVSQNPEKSSSSTSVATLAPGTIGNEIVEQHLLSTAQPKKQALRAAEKDRKHSTCKFADEICKAVINKWKEEFVTESISDSSKKSFFEKNEIQFANQGVVAGFVLYDSEKRSFECVSLGFGTKFIKYSVPKCIEIKNENISDSQDTTTKTSDTDILNDMHAEVLAKKGLVYWLSRNENANLKKLHQAKNRYSLHLYTSSAPCGNSCWKKWAKHGLGPKFEKLDCNTLPDFDVKKLPKYHFTAKKEGEGALLEKKTTNQNREENQDNDQDSKITTNVNSKSSSKESKDSTTKDADALPPEGTSFWTPESQHGPLTCSDKILIWNALGLEGNSLHIDGDHFFTGMRKKDFVPSSFLEHRIRLSSITCGRKYSEKTVKRAVYDRFNKINGVDFTAVTRTASKSSTGKDEVVAGRVMPSPFACFVTKIKFDESVYSGEDSGAVFEKNAAWWVAGQKRAETIGLAEAVWEVLEGSSGRPLFSNEDLHGSTTDKHLSNDNINKIKNDEIAEAIRAESAEQIRLNRISQLILMKRNKNSSHGFLPLGSESRISLKAAKRGLLKWFVGLQPEVDLLNRSRLVGNNCGEENVWIDE